MAPIQYKVEFLEGKGSQGQADSIVVRDAKNILTIGNQHAPLITVLENGSVECFEGEGESRKKLHSYSYIDGFLNCKDNVCEIYLLK
jgi:F0F1-type ATP synthase epsilon subunit